jgi:membrane protease YdiL (CAAX protease family)
MTKPTRPRTRPLYHDAADWLRASWALTCAVVGFYVVAALVGGALGPGLAQLALAQLTLGAVALRLGAARDGDGARALAAFGVTAPAPLALGGALLLGCAAWYPNLRLALWVQQALHGPTRVAGLERLLDGPHGWLAIAALCVLPALCEELAFRGVWTRALAARFGVAAALLITAPAFGAYHLSSAQLVPATVLGAVLGWASLRAGSLWIAVVVHAVNNAAAIAASRGALGELGDAMDAHPGIALGVTLTLAAVGATIVARASGQRAQH